MIKALIIILIVLVALFLLTFLMYFFNLDMKLLAALEPKLAKIYDKRKRDPKV
ncbi:MAG: hypothetical protein IJR10_02765 [Clostridia bacterium]|nr:hypothetical protein [Clostridia bacterium]